MQSSYREHKDYVNQSKFKKYCPGKHGTLQYKSNTLMNNEYILCCIFLFFFFYFQDKLQNEVMELKCCNQELNRKLLEKKVVAILYFILLLGNGF